MQPRKFATAGGLAIDGARARVLDAAVDFVEQELRPPAPLVAAVGKVGASHGLAKGWLSPGAQSRKDDTVPTREAVRALRIIKERVSVGMRALHECARIREHILKLDCVVEHGRRARAQSIQLLRGDPTARLEAQYTTVLQC